MDEKCQVLLNPLKNAVFFKVIYYFSLLDLLNFPVWLWSLVWSKKIHSYYIAEFQIVLETLSQKQGFRAQLFTPFKTDLYQDINTFSRCLNNGTFTWRMCSIKAFVT